MKTLKFNLIKTVSVAFVMLVILAITLVFSDNAFTVWSASGTQRFNSKEYWTGSIDEEFDDSSVLVVMDNRISGINKRYADSFFGKFPREAVYDLTYTNGETRHIDEKNFNQILQIKLPERSKENVISVIRQLEQIEGMLWAGPNHYDRPAAQPANAGGTRYSNLWGMHGNYGIQAEEVWNITTGIQNNVRVGVIDSGLDNCPDLAANIVSEGGDFVNMANMETNTPGALRADPDGHGTHVSGTIAGTGNTANGIAGVAWNVQLIPLQVSYWNTTAADWMWDVAAVTRAINWARNNNVDVINYSGGGTNNNVARRKAIENFQGLFVCAAGNNDRSNENNTGTNRLYYPSDYSRNQTFSDRVISVGAIMDNGNRPTVANWGWANPPTNTIPQGSNFGATSVSIFAPGDGILSTTPAGYGNWNGTSMATPHVTGTAALMFSLYTQMGSSLTRAQRAAAIKTAIINNAVTDDTGTPLNGLCVANGRLNAFRAVSSIVFRTSSVNGCTSIDGLATDFTLENNTNLILPDRFAPSGTMTQQNVTAIGNSAFTGCTQLIQISIPASVTNIASNAFENCTSLTGVILSNNLTSIGSSAFKRCTSLTNITIPNSVTNIGSDAFRSCSNLTNITIPPNVTSIADNTFKDCTGLISVSIPNNVTSIGSSVFENCNKLTNIALPSSLTTIGSKAFQNCKSIINLTIPGSVTSIGSNAFLNCHKLNNITIPQGINVINDSKFANCYENGEYLKNHEVVNLRVII